jgi:hypothetical protein
LYATLHYYLIAAANGAAASRRPSFNAAMGDKIIVDLEAKAEVDSKDVDAEVC